MPAEHALLGLLALEEAGAAPGAGEGAHGYDLARRFAEGQPLGDVLRLEPGMLYHHLKKLARVGWVEAEMERPGARPPRRRYRLTETGRAELRRWLGAPVAHTRELRLEFLVKYYFAQRLAPERAIRLLAEQRAILDRLAASLSTQRRALGDEHPDAAGRDRPGVPPLDRDDADLVFRRRVLDLRLAQTEAAAAWLDRLSRGE